MDGGGTLHAEPLLIFMLTSFCAVAAPFVGCRCAVPQRTSQPIPAAPPRRAPPGSRICSGRRSLSSKRWTRPGKSGRRGSRRGSVRPHRSPLARALSPADLPCLTALFWLCWHLEERRSKRCSPRFSRLCASLTSAGALVQKKRKRSSAGSRTSATRCGGSKRGRWRRRRSSARCTSAGAAPRPECGRRC